MDDNEIFAIDPGQEASGYYCGPGIHGVVDNNSLLSLIRVLFETHQYHTLAIEVFEARGMPIGKDSIETILWTGRFIEASGLHVERVTRREVKSILCGSQKAKDSNIRQALIDIYGPPGTKADPGGTYGVKSHAWAAMAVWHVVKGRLL